MRLLTPSWYGGLLTVALAMAIIGYLVVPSFYEVSPIYNYLSTVDYRRSPLSDNVAMVSAAINANPRLGDLAIFILWSLTGAALYYMILSFLRVGTNTITFIQIFQYFKNDRTQIEREIVVRLGIRLAAIVGLCGLYFGTVWIGLPYLFIYSERILGYSSLSAFIGAIGLIILTAFVIHIGVILVRIMLLRPRVFRPKYS